MPLSLNAEEVITHLQGELDSIRAESQDQLTDMDPDEAFNQGYAAALSDLRRFVARVSKEEPIVHA